MAKKKLNLYVI